MGDCLHRLIYGSLIFVCIIKLKSNVLPTLIVLLIMYSKEYINRQAYLDEDEGMISSAYLKEKRVGRLWLILLGR